MKAEQEKNKKDEKGGNANKEDDNPDVVIGLEKDTPAMYNTVMQILKKDFKKVQ